MIFQDRRDAGRQLAAQLDQYRGGDGIVLALPRGGVLVGYEVAIALEVPLDVILTHKIGPPGNPEYAIGATAENGDLVLNEAEVQAYAIPRSYVDAEALRQREEIERRRVLYREGRGLPDLHGRTALVVDDGVATGFTTAAALTAARKEGPSRLVLAVPVAPRETLRWLSSLRCVEGKLLFDEVVCLATPEPFYAVGHFYDHFEQVTDEEVCQLLHLSRNRWRTTER